jgi:hypothetical protein
MLDFVAFLMSGPRRWTWRAWHFWMGTNPSHWILLCFVVAKVSLIRTSLARHVSPCQNCQTSLIECMCRTMWVSHASLRTQCWPARTTCDEKWPTRSICPGALRCCRVRCERFYLSRSLSRSSFVCTQDCPSDLKRSCLLFCLLQSSPKLFARTRRGSQLIEEAVFSQVREYVAYGNEQHGGERCADGSICCCW